jgi:YHS domain-containing protein
MRAAFLVLTMASAGLGLALAPIGAATTELVLTNRHTGLAIDGFDPVAYFVNAEPRVGRPEFEHGFAGATWRFCNEGNRAAFAAHPEVYMPHFGGYDPLAVARGVATRGHPELWLIVRQRLYLFHNASALEAFAQDPERAIESAERHWRNVQRTLAP